MDIVVSSPYFAVWKGQRLTARPQSSSVAKQRPAASPRRLNHAVLTPPLLSGNLGVVTQSGELSAYASYIYDSIGKRIYFSEFGQYDNHQFKLDVLLLFNQGVKYTFNNEAGTCKKTPLKKTFMPADIPRNATFLSEEILGTSSIQGQGLLVNTWTGDVPATQGKYMTTVTQIGCIPVSSLYYTPKTGWIVTSFINTVLGMANPELLLPPKTCDNAPLETTEPEDFFSTFRKKGSQ
ncbi:ependymin-like [Chanos chanos]|uniref:Ependymin-like n=1 Tax=Chanos chanos TaxID=29144 RepID=A0A6J2VU92_CHACN|nr:ependymin-like [Chanos chanos]